MPSRPKGFDPLASLFEPTEPEASEEVARTPLDTGSPEFSPVLEPTDSFFSAPTSGPRAPVSRVAPPAPAGPTPPPVDPVALARILARTAAARAGPPGSAPRKTRTPPEPSPVVEPAGRSGTRLEELARRDLRPRTAEEVLADMAHRPAPPTPRPASTPAGTSVGEVQEMLTGKVKGLSDYRVANCVRAEPRQVLKALWKAHRTRFASEGRLDSAVAAAAVLDALDQVPENRLSVAHVVTKAQDYLLWLDTGERRLIAGFADARTLLAGR
ncbi:MAG: hypothetical protein JXB39_14240 [Deltaproteobacteria bacterium]|nr:hypothetical protein [Deltaproteobacteria bacterium]